jgi:hypothetical protein
MIAVQALAADQPLVGRDGKPLVDLSGSSLQAAPGSDCFIANGTPGCDDQQCENTVCAIDSFCCDVSWDGICAGEALDVCVVDDEWPAPPNGEPGIARILVAKDFTDDSTEPVHVNIECNGGQPLQNEFDISEGETVIFNLENYQIDETDCTVTEVVPAGYSAVYYDQDLNESSDGCTFEDLPDAAGLACYVRNTAEPVTVTINAVWDFGGIPNDIAQIAQANLECSPVGSGPASWGWDIVGDYSRNVAVVPYWDGGSDCTVSYEALESAVEASGCEDVIHVELGGGDQECTITFTAFFEGVPAIGRTGMVLLVLLTLGLGFFAFRRFS